MRSLGVALFAVSLASGLEAQQARTVAFVDVNVVPMDAERIHQGQTLIVRNGRIAEFGSAAQIDVPGDALRIDGTGKYLMPGLADMHVHATNEGALKLFVANGITTVRNMWGTPLQLDWREKISRGEMLGPQIFTAGPLIDGSPPIWDGSTVVETPEEAEAVVREHKEAGYDFIKVYSRLTREVYDALIAAAAKHGIRVVGHVPDAVGLMRVLEARQASIEHLAGYLYPTLADDSPLDSTWQELPFVERTKKTVELGRALVEGQISFHEVYDERKLARVAAATTDAGTWNVPTLTVFQYVTVEEAPTVLARPEMRYVNPMTRGTWDPSRFYADFSTEEMGYLRIFNEAKKWRVKALHDAGARILLGTDTPNPFVVPGFSIHQELHHLVAVGLTPYEAIKAGTRDAAEFLEALDSLGTIAPGKIADLILVDDNPFEDVANVARRAGVMLRGRWLPESELQAMLEELAASYTAPKTRFADMPPLPTEGTRKFSARYESMFGDVTFGEERFAVEEVSDGGWVIVGQAVTDPPFQSTTALRWVLDSAGRTRELSYESETQQGTMSIRAERGDTTVWITGTLASGDRIERIESMARDALLDAPAMASAVPLAMRLAHLSVGDSARLTIKSLELFSGFEISDQIMTVTRAPDAEREVMGSTVPVRVYEGEVNAPNMSYEMIVAFDHEGWPVSFGIRGQFGSFSVRRVQ